MSNVISIDAVRAERLKQAFAIHARNGETVIIEARSGPVVAERIVCRDRIAEILDDSGGYQVIAYNDIRSLHVAPVVQTSVVNARGEFLPTLNLTAASRPAAILPFALRRRRG